MNTKHAFGIVIAAAGLFSSAAFAQSTSYWNIPQSFGAASAGPVAQMTSAASGFETSWLHLRESHGVGLPVAQSAGGFVGTGAHCDTRPVAIYESSWLNLRETHGVGVSDARFAGSAGTDPKC